MKTGSARLQLSVLCLLISFTLGTPSTAQVGDSADSWSVDAAVSVVSDYRFRGFSLNNERPAVQSELWIAHHTGVYTGVWGSNVADLGGDGIEFDPSIGFATSVGVLEIDIWTTYYLYPGASEFNYIEIGSKISTLVGPATIGLELGYAPSQDNIGGIDNRYASAFASAPLGATGITLEGAFGVEDGAFGDNKLDWSAGASTELKGFTLSAHYMDAARHAGSALADPTIVAAVRYSF